MSFFGDNGRGRRRVPEARPHSAPARRKGPSLSTIVLVLVMVAGAGIMGYPTFSDWWNSFHQTRVIASYVQAVESADPELIERMLSEARAYNERLAKKGAPYIISDEERKEYEALLDLSGTGVMGYIQMKTLGIDYPIYHGVDEAILQVAIGHLEGSALPVGGASTHAVVTGHRGLPRAKLFSDLDKAKEGDTFTVTVMRQTITYEVDQIRIVEPEDMNDLAITPGEDYMTLVTCTPYGINTHRLLVRGHRVENAKGAIAIPAEAVQIPNYVAVPAVGIPLLFVYLVASLVGYRKNDRRAGREKVLEALHKMEGGDGRDGSKT